MFPLDMSVCAGHLCNEHHPNRPLGLASHLGVAGGLWAAGCTAPWVKAGFPWPAHQQCLGLPCCLAPSGASLGHRLRVAGWVHGAGQFPLPVRVFVLQARRIIGDFGIPISILVMVLVDYTITDTYTQVGTSTALGAPSAAQQ